MKTMVIGASHKPYRYSHQAIKMLKEYNHDVIPVGKRARVVDEWDIVSGHPDEEGVHTITLYLNAGNQQEYYDYILGLKPQRVIFNPGAENPELARILEENGIEVVNGCTLVMLRAGLY